MFPKGKYMYVEYLWSIPMIYFPNIRETFAMKFRGISPNNFPGIMNLGIFHEYPANVTCIFYVDQELQYQFFLIYKAVPDIHCVSLKILVFS